MGSGRLHAESTTAADRADPLAAIVERFERPDPQLSYLDGNSLGRPPVAARAAATAAFDAWSTDLVGAWEQWLDRGVRVGERLAPILGAAPGQVVVGESTTVALYKAVDAARRARLGRSVIVAVRDDFPTDRYVVAGIAANHALTVRWVDAATPEAVRAALDPTVAVVVASVVHFVTAALAPVGDITALAHAAGALVVWDCSHATGAVPLALDDDAVDLAVGCTYKYLHGGPGAPAFTYVNAAVADRLDQPIHGWFGQHQQFAMGPDYDPVPGVGRWQTGTPGILGLDVAGVGIDLVAEVDMTAIRAKSLALGHVMLDAYDEWFEPLGLALVSPRTDADRGGHVGLAHPDASRIVRAARLAGVITDFRTPDVIRLGPGPLATTFTELLDGLDRLRTVIAGQQHLALPADPGAVT